MKRYRVEYFFDGRHLHKRDAQGFTDDFTQAKRHAAGHLAAAIHYSKAIISDRKKLQVVGIFRRLPNGTIQWEQRN